MEAIASIFTGTYNSDDFWLYQKYFILLWMTCGLFSVLCCHKPHSCDHSCVYVCVCVCVLVAQLYPTLCDPLGYNLPGSSVHGILQARILEWVAISFSRGSSQPRDQTRVSCITGIFFTSWTSREAQGMPNYFQNGFWKPNHAWKLFTWIDYVWFVYPFL